MTPRLEPSSKFALNRKFQSFSNKPKPTQKGATALCFYGQLNSRLALLPAQERRVRSPTECWQIDINYGNRGRQVYLPLIYLRQLVVLAVVEAGVRNQEDLYALSRALQRLRGEGASRWQ